MAWNISGIYWAPCSCNVGCPCTLGEMEGDRGWCSGSLVFDIQRGQADGVDVSGTKVALAADWPSGFLAGNGTGRLYFDPSVSEEQRAALEGIVTGKQGGALEAIGMLVSNFLPSKEAAINIQKKDDEVTVKVGDFGTLVSRPLRGATGEPTRLLHAAAAFRDDIILGNGRGTQWHDPELRRWEGGGHSEIGDFDWSG